MLAPTELDENYFIENPIWKVILSNEEVFVSDNKIIDNKSEWIRLKEYCRSNNLTIKEMYIAFRDNVKKIPEGKFYFFRKMALCGFDIPQRKDKTYQYFVVGSTNDKNMIHLYKYMVPEMSIQEEEDRILEDDEVSLI